MPPIVEWIIANSTDVVVICVTLVIAYVIFGISGFGSAVIAAPILAHRMPVASVVSLLALLDFAAAVINGVTLNRQISYRELVGLVPLMVAGSIIGATLLISMPANQMVAALGMFVVTYGAYGIFAPPMQSRFGRIWVLPFGIVGGLFSGMFGSGGFIYSIYLTHRLADKDAIRATQSTIIALSTLTRVAIFFTAGIYTDIRLVLLALAGLPALLLGIFLGHRITLHLSHQQFLRILYLLLIGIGSALLLRAASV